MNNYQAQILEKVNGATSSIKLAVSWLTDPVLLRKLIYKAKSGVNVQVLLSGDDFNLTRYHDLKELENAGGALRKRGNKNALDGNFMHAKLLIVDNLKAYGGSYNWTHNAQSNYETFDEFVNTHTHSNLFYSWFRDAEPLLKGLTLADVNKRLEALELEYKEVAFQARVLPTNFQAMELSDHFRMLNEKQKKADHLKSTASKIANGASTINKAGQPIAGTSGISSKPHRYHGGGSQIGYADRQRKPFAVAHFQKYFINKYFSFLRTWIENHKLICRGIFQPEGCQPYDVRIEFSAGFPPVVKILNMEVEAKFDIHLYNDCSLCLFYPGDMKWTDHTKIAEYTIPWITEWIYYYEIWKLTGKWEGKESPAHTKNCGA